MTSDPGSPFPPPAGQGPPAGSDQFFYLYVMGQEQGPYNWPAMVGMATTGTLKSDTNVRMANGGSWFPAKQVPGLFSDKEWLVTLLISFFVGGLGIDRFYLGYTGLGILKLLTCGGLGVWALVDLILIAMRKLPDANGRPLA